jgi:ribosomal protein S27E
MYIGEFLERNCKSPFDSAEGKPVASASRVERMFGPKETWQKKTEPATNMNEIIEAAEAARPKRENRENRKQEPQEGYRGFLLLRCPHCGKVQAFCARNYLTEAKCQGCGESFPLEDLIPAHVNCVKCSGHYRYRTNNITQEPVPFNCFGCGAPIDLELNKKGTALVTVGYSHGGGGSHNDSPFRAPKPFWMEK